jgi:hypothetical protein
MSKQGGKDMRTQDANGALLHGEDANARREAARLMGKASTERKKAAARENGKKNTFTEETRAKLRAGQAARREREREEREAAGVVTITPEKKRAGRPRKVQEGMRSE